MAGGKVYPHDIVKKRFGSLFVSAYAGYWNHKHHYLCECDCGAESTVLRESLLNGRSKSCGHCIEPHIEQEGDYYRYFCTNGRTFIFDECDLKIISNLLCTVSERGYVSFDRKKSLLTHYLLGVDGSVTIDHINGDPFDNRRCNLRIATDNKNKWNYSISSRNTTGYKGIVFQYGKYHAKICVNGKRIYLGGYNTPEEAARAYDNAARIYHGEFACVNFPLPSEQGCRRNEEREGLTA